METHWPTPEKLAYQLATQHLARSASVSADVPRLLVASQSSAQAARGLAAGATLQIDLFEPEHYRFARLFSTEPSSSGQLPSSGKLPQSIAASAEKLHLCETAIEQFPSGSTIRWLCQSDPPADVLYDLAILSLRRDGTSEWAREMIQEFAARLHPEGTFIVVTDHGDDAWVGDQLRLLAKSVRRERLVDTERVFAATAYLVGRDKMRLRSRSYACQFAFRDRGQLIQVCSRPGVFSHRKLDLGARRLIDAMVLEPGSRVLDLGCGSGVVGLAAALRDPSIFVTAIDSHARAVECTAKSAALNQVIDRYRVLLSSACESGAPGTFDVVFANPPYFAQMQIAELFLEGAVRALRPGGQLFAVCKQPQWYQVHAPRWFDRVGLTETHGGYWIVAGRAPEKSLV